MLCHKLTPNFFPMWYIILCDCEQPCLILGNNCLTFREGLCSKKNNFLLKHLKEKKIVQKDANNK